MISTYNLETSIDLSSLRPLNDCILLLRLPELRHETLKILVPEIAQKPSHRGVVIRKGPGKKFDDGTRRPIDVTLNDVVHYQSCDVDDGTYVLIREGDVLFIENR
jgi:chaperonin GroES